MFILGLLAFMQSVFLPGFIIFKFTGFKLLTDTGKPGKIKLAVTIFGLSLLINYLSVFAFTALGLYKPLTMYIVLFIEGGLLIYYWIVRSAPPHCCFFTVDLPKISDSLRNFFANHTLRYNLLLILSVGVIFGYVFLFFYFLGGVFEHWDPVVGWNRFALDWASNRLPVQTLHYPQLIPSNWSVSYVMMQNTDIQCFAKAFMPLFSIGNLLLFFDLGLRKNKGVYFLGVILYGILLGYIYTPSYIVSGYVDIAVSFFAFLSFYFMHGSSNSNNGNQMPLKTYWLALVFASTAAITKQAGLYILIIVLVWILYLTYFKKYIEAFRSRRKTNKPQERRAKKTNSANLHTETPLPPASSKVLSNLEGRRKITWAFLLIMTVCIITVPWYLIKEIHIESGLDRSEVHMVQQAHHTINLTKRFAQSMDHLLTHRHPKLKYPVMLMGLIMLLGLFHRRSWGVTLFIVIPFLLLWGFFFSYDFRNLCLAVPFMAFSTAFGVDFLRKFIPKPDKLPSLRIPLILMMFAIFLVAAVLNFTLISDEALLHNQNTKKYTIGYSELNALLYDYNNKIGFSGKIATNYQYLKYLPGLQNYYWYHPGRVTKQFLMALETPELSQVHYLLIPYILKSEKDVFQYYREKIEKKEYRLIFKWQGYHFIKVK